ncbi:MAG: hypothetical protein EXS59_02520 [Candidatus Taylorbacteria bacterium]|nr:hypothetical protein [Candidatus Taylorbacteria bacterium]
MQTQTSQNPTSATTTVALSGFDGQTDKIHQGVRTFILALLKSAGLTGNYRFLAIGNCTSGQTFPINGIKVKGTKGQSVEMIVQVDGKKYRYFGHLQVLESGMRPEVLHANLRAVCDKKFYNPANPPKRNFGDPKVIGVTDLKNPENPFIPMPDFDEGNIGLALLALSQQSGADKVLRIGSIASILTKELNLGNINPADFETSIGTWITNGYLQKVDSDKVQVTLKGKALFEPVPVPVPMSENPHSVLPTPAPETNRESTPRVGRPVRELLEGMQQLLEMAQKLGSALKNTETITRRIEEANTDIVQMEKVLREKRDHRGTLMQQRADYLKITTSEEHKAARQFVLLFREAKLDTTT